MLLVEKLEQVKQLKREGNHLGAVQILDEIMAEEEARARKQGDGVGQWAYEQSAIIARKIKEYDAEIEVLERFARQRHASAGGSERLLSRLVRAYELGGKIEKREIAGKKVLFHIEKGMPLEELDLFVRVGAIVDCETTGLTNTDELIELGIITFRYNTMSGKVLEIMDEYSGLREPKCPISKGAQAVHGLTKNDLRKQSLESYKIRGLLKNTDILFAHNAAFDRRFIGKLFPDAANMQWFCSMSTIPWRKRGFSSKGLQSLLLEHDIESEESHRALADCRALLSLLRCTDKVTNKPYLFSVAAIPRGWGDEYDSNRSRSRDDLSISIGIEQTVLEPERDAKPIVIPMHEPKWDVNRIVIVVIVSTMALLVLNTLF